MKSRALFLACLVAACGGNEEETPADDDAPQATNAVTADPAQAARALAQVLARIGGTVITAGDYFVEVVPQRDGKVEALVSDASGTVVEGSELTVQVKGDDGESYPVRLRWDAEAGRYVGEVEANVELADGQVEVAVEKDGETSRGRADKLAVAPVPTHGGTVLVAGDYVAEVKPSMEEPGKVLAYVQGPDGPLAGRAGANVTVEVQGSDGTPHELEMTWSPEAAVYVGALDGDVTVATGPMALDVAVQGVTRRSRVETVAVSRPTHGGDVVVTGDYSVEVVPKEDGIVEAYVVDARGAPVQGEEGTVEVVVAGAPRTLTWNPEVGAYTTTIGADVDINAAPVGVVVRHRGRRHRGGIHVARGRAFRRVWAPRVNVAAAAAYEARTTRRAARPGVAAEVNVRAPGVRVRGPGVDIRGGMRTIRVPTGGTVMAHGVRIGRRTGVQVTGPAGGMVRITTMGRRGITVMRRGMGMGMR